MTMSDENGLLNAEVLSAYCDHTLDDTALIEQVRSSPLNKRWVSQYRFMRILLRESEGRGASSPVEADSINRFIDEDLPLDEMKRIEAAICADHRLKDEYMGNRLEYLARDVSVPKELDDRVLAMFEEEEVELKRTAHAEKAIVEERISWISWFLDTVFPAPAAAITKIDRFFSTIMPVRHLAWGGSALVIALVGITGGKHLGLIGQPPVSPLVMASLQFEERLVFRGAAQADENSEVDAQSSTNKREDKLLKSITAELDQSLIDDIVNFQKSPNHDDFENIVKSLVRPEDGDAAHHYTIERLQIDPKLWQEITSGQNSSTEVKAQIGEIFEKGSTPGDGTGANTDPITVLYLSSPY